MGRWEGGDTNTGPAFSDFRKGSIPAAFGRKMRFAGTSVVGLEQGRDHRRVGTGRCVERCAQTQSNSYARTGRASGEARRLAATWVEQYVGISESCPLNFLSAS